MGKRSCVLGCPPGETLYSFPIKGKDEERRNKWLDFFDMEEENKKCLYACALHFSNKQKAGGKISRDSVPDLANYPERLPIFQTNPYLSICKSSSTQTNTRLCGSVLISDCFDKYTLNCFYCSETFPLVNWLEFVDHLKEQHFKEEQAFEDLKYPYDDHLYTKLPQEPKVRDKTSSNENLRPETTDTLLNDTPEELKDNQLCTVKSKTEDDPLAIKNFKKNKPSSVPENVKRKRITKNKNATTHANRVIRKDLTIRSTPMRMKRFVINKSTTETKSMPEFLDDLESCSLTSFDSQSSKANQINQEEGEPIANKSKKNNTIFGTGKNKQPQRVITSGIFYIKDIKNNTVTAKQSSSKTALNRCLKRANNVENETLSENQILFNTTELVFQFTPRDIMVDLLDNIKYYPILWEFHTEPNNEEYDVTIQELCLQFNTKWSLNLTPLQMRRSINRILSFYRYMLPCEKVVIFAEYYEKCCEFLPSSEDDIPHKRCEYCDICCATELDLRKHLVEEHDYLKLPFKCDHCSDRFMKKDEFEMHKQLPHYMEIFRCQHCNKRFNHRHVLKRHLKLHEPPPPIMPLKMYKCDECDKEFKNTSELASHKIYHEEKSFQCHLCPKSFYRKLTLTGHLKRHLNQLDYICEICGKAFLEQSHLNDHMDKHTGAKVTCNICNLKLRKCSLSRHLRLIHVAYEGTIESTFRAKSYHYKKHIQPYSKKYAQTEVYKSSNVGKEEGPRKYDCKKCCIHFDRLKLLKDHNNEIHPDVKMFYCKICNIEFRHKPNLKRHYRDKHKLHKLQIIKLLHHNEDLDKVLNLKIKDLSPDTEAEYYSMIIKNDSPQREDANEETCNEDHLVNDFLIDF